MTKATTFTVFANIDNMDTSKVSSHRTLKAAGKSYQSAHTGNMRRVIDSNGKDVTFDAVDAANGF